MARILVLPPTGLGALLYSSNHGRYCALAMSLLQAVPSENVIRPLNMGAYGYDYRSGDRFGKRVEGVIKVAIKP